MNPFSILLLGLAMSTDAFAAALGKGAAMRKPQLRQALRAGLIFGSIEAITPVIGWLLGRSGAAYIQAWGHWVAFALLLVLGLHMVYSGLKPGHAEAVDDSKQHSVFSLALTGISTSIDAAAVGVGLALVNAPIATVALVIGMCTFVMVTLGIMLGRVLGALVGQRAELVGGIILIGVGVAILRAHVPV